MSSRRLFLAIWPEEEQVEQLFALQGEYTAWGRQVIPENFHITLLFLGQVEDEAMQCLIQNVSSITFEPFRISLDQLGYFDKTKIFWVGPKETPSELESMFKKLRNCAIRCGFSQLTKRYVPHVTLLRKADVPVSDPNFKPIEWLVRDFHLVESQMDREGAHYATIQSFPDTIVR
jgi:2'-5' RNA ligase